MSKKTSIKTSVLNKMNQAKPANTANQQLHDTVQIGIAGLNQALGQQTVAKRLGFLMLHLGQDVARVATRLTLPERTVLPVNAWLQNTNTTTDEQPSFVDVKLAYDIAARYRAAYRDALYDLQAWKRQTDSMLLQMALQGDGTIQGAKGQGAKRVSASLRQLALYLIFDGEFLWRRLVELQNVYQQARREADALAVFYQAGFSRFV